MENKSQAALDLFHVSSALATAVNMRFMSPEHASLIWKQFLHTSGLDVPKKQPQPKPEDKNAGKEVT